MMKLLCYSINVNLAGKGQGYRNITNGCLDLASSLSD